MARTKQTAKKQTGGALSQAPLREVREAAGVYERAELQAENEELAAALAIEQARLVTMGEQQGRLVRELVQSQTDLGVCQQRLGELLRENATLKQENITLKHENVAVTHDRDRGIEITKRQK